MYNEKGVYLPGDGVQVDMFDCIKANVINLLESDDDMECAEIVQQIFNWIEGARSRMRDLDKEAEDLRKKSFLLAKEKERLEGMVYALEQQVKVKEQ